MIESVRELKIGDNVKTQIFPMSQKYIMELENQKEMFGEDSDEFKIAQEEYDDIWGEKKGILIRIGECFAECYLKNNEGKEIPMIHSMVCDLGHWENSESFGGKFFVNIEIE
jgi:hypothetical protein